MAVLTDVPVTYLANPYVKCGQAGCSKRVVGVIGFINIPGVLPARNWPCYHNGVRSSVCPTWTAEAGCTCTPAARRAHGEAFEGNRR